MAPDASPESDAPRPRRGRIGLAFVVVAMLLVAAAFSIGRLTAPVTGTPANTSDEAGFARDMQVHHAQAIEMAFIIRDETSDPDIRLLAYDIATSQQQQIGQMYGWLVNWNLPQANAEPSMTWMTRPTLKGAAGHEHGVSTSAHTPGDPMPGYATDAQLATLKSLTGVAAEKEFLTLMIAHHKGGVEMAQAILDRSTEPVVVTLAKSIVTSQTAEISLMQSMLAARSLPPGARRPTQPSSSPFARNAHP